MKRIFLSLVVLLVTTAVMANDAYVYTVDLTKVSNDQILVELETPKISAKEIKFFLPKIIPGTYAIADYGRMVSNLEAFDKKGKSLAVERQDDNTWIIKKAKKLRSLKYLVEDTYDTEKEGPEIFQPAGTNIEAGKNFIFNGCGFFGYFEGMKKQPFELNFVREKGFYGATGLSQKAAIPAGDLVVDQFEIEDYDRLVDSPLMYSATDTATVKVANTEVLIANYSPNKLVTAKEIAASIAEVLAAQSKFLGGKLPVDKYAFIFYFTDEPVMSFGALEHSYSSFYFMPEQTIDVMEQQLRDFAAHEFFHIVTPLTIHSEEIGSFDFNDPKMSRHLWMYEGMTEYFAGSVQVKYGLVSPEQYLGMLQEKLLIATQFKDELPFTELSLGALEEHADQYYNVYQKGALIGAALDIQLRELSDGAYGVQNMMAELSKKYGINASFKDEALFDEIVEMTYPAIDSFLQTYVAGSTPLPYEAIFDKVGVDLVTDGTMEQYSLVIAQNTITVKPYNGVPMLAIANADALDDLGKALGLETGDVLIKMNGKEIPALGPEINNFMNEQYMGLAELENFSFTVAREIDGENKLIELITPNRKVAVPVPLMLEFNTEATPEQLRLRKFWLEPAE
ncbi:MAG: peptidase M61 [Saprospiraceae bacterium]